MCGVSDRRHLHRVVRQWVAAQPTPLAPVSMHGSDGVHRLLQAAVGMMGEARGMPGLAGPVDPGDREFLLREPLRTVLQDVDALGQLYQALNAPALEAAYRATARDRRKFRPAEIAAVTQLFTPAWVAEFLVQNTLGAMWMELHPDSTLRDRLTWLVGGSATGVERVAPLLIGQTRLASGPAKRAGGDGPDRSAPLVRDLRLLDPACGTMNFGAALVDLLEPMYREEFERAGQPGWPAVASVADLSCVGETILRHNLYGVDIDPVALELARHTLNMRLRCDVAPNLLRADALKDRRGTFLGEAFDVVVTNPPYLSARNLPPAVARGLKTDYPSAWRDLYACFLVRSLSLLRDGGRFGVLTMHSFMFTGGYEPLRRAMAERSTLETLAHFGPGLFDVGNRGTLQTVAAVLRRSSETSVDATAACFGLTGAADEDAKRAMLIDAVAAARDRRPHACAYPVGASFMLQHARCAWSYWVAPALAVAARGCRRLEEIAPPRQGLATTDNARFVRYWWEVDSPEGAPLQASAGRWLPYAKGGGFRRWYAEPQHVVDWEGGGRAIKRAVVERYPYLKGKWQWVAKNTAYYGLPGITWSYLTSGTFSARLLPEGCIFDVAGSSVFPDGDPLPLLGVLNSTCAGRLLHAINPTINFQAGDLAQLPVPDLDPRSAVVAELRADVSRAVGLQRLIDRHDPTSRAFTCPPSWPDGAADVVALARRRGELEVAIDQRVERMYGLPETPAVRRAEDGRDDDGREPAARGELARQWVNYALTVVFARDGQGIDPVPVVQAARRVREVLGARLGPIAVDEVALAVGGMEKFLRGRFFPWHFRLFRRRPVLWVLDGADGPHVMAHWMMVGGGPLDDGIPLRLAAVAGRVMHRDVQREVLRVQRDVRDGRYPWSSRPAPVGIV
jgi:hypothetical protein